MEHNLSNILGGYVAEATSNNIQQHTPEWHDAKQFTIGGSLMAAIQGASPYCTREQLLADKTVGSAKAGVRHTTLAMNWGTLFEDILRDYVERDMRTSIVADNAFIFGPPGTHTSYSPDGIGILDVDQLSRFGIDADALCADVVSHQSVTPVPPLRRQHIALFEFKCLFSRIPGASPPAYYVPQVKTGLDIIPVADYGLLIEAVFRRCPWVDMGVNAKYDRVLAKQKYGTGLLAMGIVGFTHDAAAFNEKLAHARACGSDARADRLYSLRARLYRQYASEYGGAACAHIVVDTDTTIIEPSAANTQTQDLALATRELITTVLECYVEGVLDAWIGESVIDNDDVSARRKLNESLATFHYTVADRVNFGILPWKLFGLRMHAIHRTRDYIAQWQPAINEVIDTARTYHQLPPAERDQYYHTHIYTPPVYKIIDG